MRILGVVGDIVNAPPLSKKHKEGLAIVRMALSHLADYHKNPDAVWLGGLASQLQDNCQAILDKIEGERLQKEFWGIDPSMKGKNNEQQRGN